VDLQIPTKVTDKNLATMKISDIREPMVPVMSNGKKSRHIDLKRKL
jgi:hypothetical protein